VLVPVSLHCVSGVDGVADGFGLADEDEDSGTTRRTTNERANERI